LKCDEACKGCSGSLDSECTSCFDGYKLETGECIGCGNGEFLNSNFECEPVCGDTFLHADEPCEITFSEICEDDCTIPFGYDEDLNENIPPQIKNLRISDDNS
jgi:hypothetical protein